MLAGSLAFAVAAGWEVRRAVMLRVVSSIARRHTHDIALAQDPVGFWFAATVFMLGLLFFGLCAFVFAVSLLPFQLFPARRLPPAFERRLAETPEPHRASPDPTA